MIRRWAMTDRSKRGHEVSQLEGQAITHRHPPVSPSDTDRRENDAHSQLVEGSALLSREIDVPRSFSAGARPCIPFNERAGAEQAVVSRPITSELSFPVS